MIKAYISIIILVLISCSNYIFPQTGGKISGVVFMDYFYNASRDTGISSLPNVILGGQKDANGFDIRRALFTYDYQVSENFTTRFRLEADGRSLTDNKKFGVFVKDAFIRWKEVLPNQELIFGIQPPPAYEVSEAYYGFRSLEKTIMDARGIVASRDFGISAKGKIVNELNYWLMFANNSANGPETDRYKRIYAHLSLKPVTNFTATLYSDLKFRQKISSRASDEMLSNNIITSAVFIGYSDSKTFSVGTETFYQITENGYFNSADKSAEDLNGIGVSAFGWLKLHEKLTATLRFDYFDPGLSEELKYDSRNYIIAGLSYTPVQKVAIIPNILIETYEDSERRSVDASVTPRITIVYEFL